MNQLDHLDKQILERLLEDARIPYKSLATDLNVSNSLIHQRIRKMTNDGIISGSTILINRETLGYHTLAYIGIVLSNAEKCRYVARRLKSIREVTECNLVSGKHAIFIKTIAKDNNHLRDIIFDQIHKIDGVSSTDTVISFETSFDREIKF